MLRFHHLQKIFTSDYNAKPIFYFFFMTVLFLSGSWGGCWSLSQLNMDEGRVHPWMRLVESLCIEHLGGGLRYLDQGYLGGALKVSWQLPLVPEHILCFFLLKCHSCYMSDYPPNINLRCQDHASKCDNHLKALSSTKGQNLYTGSKIEGFNRWHGQIMQERMNKLVLRL